MIDKTQAWLLLNNISGLGQVKIKNLLGQYETVENIFLQKSFSKHLNLPLKAQQAIKNPDLHSIKLDLLWLEKSNNYILTIEDDLYPPLLHQTDSAPPLLYITGDPNVLLQPQLAVVGSRSATPIGIKNTYSFCSDLASNGLTITSGMALGIDGAAHKSAIEIGGKTIAVLGTGLDSVYPAKHRNLAHEIAKNGALISEFSIGTKPHAYNFPRRNRIICGLALGTLVVEAGLKSGTLITARQTMEINRPVMAIPGSIHSPMAKGCHQLIKQGAKLVETAQEIVEELAPLAESLSLQIKEKIASLETLPQKPGKNEMDDSLSHVLKHINYDATPLEEIIKNSNTNAQDIASILIELEITKKVQALPGAQYQRV